MTRAFIMAGLLWIAAGVSSAEPLGRLFYTPAQRAQLDALRSQKNVAPPVQETKEPVAVPETVTYGGVVRRSDGKSTVWLNNRVVNDGKPLDDLSISSRVRPDHRVTIRLPQAPGSVELKVGQSIDVQSGAVMEPYARRGSEAGGPAPRASQTRPSAASALDNARRAADDEDEERSRR